MYTTPQHQVMQSQRHLVLVKEVHIAILCLEEPSLDRIGFFWKQGWCQLLPQYLFICFRCKHAIQQAS